MQMIWFNLLKNLGFLNIGAIMYMWSHSSVGQSVRLITVRSAVRARVGPFSYYEFFVLKKYRRKYEASKLRDRESNPGHPRDRRIY